MNCRDAEFYGANVFPRVHRDAVGGLAVSPREEQHQALRLGEKSEPRFSRVTPTHPPVIVLYRTWFGSNQPRCCVLCLPQYVVVSSKKILFYNSEQDKELSNPYMVLDIE